jgi:EAL domain-containing protein (putative c-di-GMP-specific phosphodiesterase class I)
LSAILGHGVDLQKACSGCRNGIGAPFDFSMAFQPIVDLAAGRIYAYEALVRGPQGQPAQSVLSKVTVENRYSFDQSCRVRAIDLASRLGVQGTGASLSINFIPGAMYNPESCVRATLAVARRCALPLDRLIFELTEQEEVTDFDHLGRIFETYRSHQFRTAIDDFGTGYSSLQLLADFRPDTIKIDMSLVRGIGADSRREAIVRALTGLARDLAVAVVAEGVETRAELDALRTAGIKLFQGYFFAKPAFERLPAVPL